MGCCTGRCTLLFICCLQLITAVERQVFDFLGYQWAPIMVNFLQIVMVILGLFGTAQYRPRYIVLYLVWSLLWVGWNVFVSCLFLDLGGLSKDSDILTLGLGTTSHGSWWRDQGPGCQQTPLQDLQTSPAETNPQLITVVSCWMEFQYVEVLHCTVQLLISLLGFVYACYVVSTLPDHDDSFEFHHPSKMLF